MSNEILCHSGAGFSGPKSRSAAAQACALSAFAPFSGKNEIVPGESKLRISPMLVLSVAETPAGSRVV
jgi:hypothetical protein